MAAVPESSGSNARQTTPQRPSPIRPPRPPSALCPPIPFVSSGQSSSTVALTTKAPELPLPNLLRKASHSRVSFGSVWKGYTTNDAECFHAQSPSCKRSTSTRSIRQCDPVPSKLLLDTTHYPLQTTLDTSIKLSQVATTVEPSLVGTAMERETSNDGTALFTTLPLRLRPRYAPPPSKTKVPILPVMPVRVRKRPAALRLQTSNLSPTPEASTTASGQALGRMSEAYWAEAGRRAHPRALGAGIQAGGSTSHNKGADRQMYSADDGQMSPLPRPSSVRRRSKSVNDLRRKKEAVEPYPLPKWPDFVFTPTHQDPAAPAPTSATVNADADVKANADIGKSILQPQSDSPAKVTPTDDITQTFNAIPLPWSLIPITPSLSLSHLPSTLSSLPSTPHILSSPLLSAARTESSRLSSERHRLTIKYAKLISSRNALQAHIESGILRSVYSTDALLCLFNSLRKLSERCDRAARQMHVCNDQVRQIEVQLEMHKVGALVWERNKRKGDGGWSEKRKKEDRGGKGNAHSQTIVEAPVTPTALSAEDQIAMIKGQLSLGGRKKGTRGDESDLSVYRGGGLVVEAEEQEGVEEVDVDDDDEGSSDEDDEEEEDEDERDYSFDSPGVLNLSFPLPPTRSRGATGIRANHLDSEIRFTRLPLVPTPSADISLTSNSVISSTEYETLDTPTPSTSTTIIQTATLIKSTTPSFTSRPPPPPPPRSPLPISTDLKTTPERQRLRPRGTPKSHSKVSHVPRTQGQGQGKMQVGHLITILPPTHQRSASVPLVLHSGIVNNRDTERQRQRERVAVGVEYPRTPTVDHH